MNDMSKLLIFSGLLLVGVGIVFALAGKVPWIGKLPGDLHIRKEGFSFHFPLVTCLLLSLLITLFLNLFGKK